MKYVALFIVLAGLASCGTLGNGLTRSNARHAHCLHFQQTHNYVQVGEYCACKPQGGE